MAEVNSFNFQTGNKVLIKLILCRESIFIISEFYKPFSLNIFGQCYLFLSIRLVIVRFEVYTWKLSFPFPSSVINVQIQAIPGLC